MARSSYLHLISSRERDCLRLLQAGLQTAEVASNLGISVSTLNKHLTSVRRKLHVSRTSQALLLVQRNGEYPVQDEGPQIKAVDEVQGESSLLLCDFMSALDACRTFNDAWAVFEKHLQRLGVPHVVFGVIAEPPGQLTNGTQIFKYDMPDQVAQMYEKAGGARLDPMAPFISQSERSVFVDNELILRTLPNRVPKEMRLVGEAVMDHGGRFMLLQPERDKPTGAPFGACFVLDKEVARDARHGQTPFTACLQIILHLFCNFLQSKRLLSDFAGLTNRQREALDFVARGFTTMEAAEQMGVSTRSVEKLLAAARDILGARTTSAALYRAMVYRALA